MDNESNCDKETERQREWTMIPGFFVGMNTRAHFLKQSHKLSHQNTQEECVSVCVFACAVCICVIVGEKPPSSSVYGQGTLTIHSRADLGNIKASACGALWVQQRMSVCR
jgi:hypothetical protein